MHLVVDEAVDAIFLGETFDQVLLVERDPLRRSLVTPI
jgi:hypothetical protein